NELDILEENNYYPFGLKHKIYGGIKKDYLKEEPGNGGGGAIRPGVVIDGPYNYKYNGKEFQDELGLGLYDYGWRNYDPELGRWHNVDPLAEKSRRNSPYVYALNNPIYYIDPDGMKGEDWKSDANGNISYDPNLTKENASTQLKNGEEWVAHEGSVDDYQLNADGSFTDTRTGDDYSGGQSVTLESGFT